MSVQPNHIHRFRRMHWCAFAVVAGLLSAPMISGAVLHSPDSPDDAMGPAADDDVERSAAYVERGPIRIFFPWEFTAENGVVSGNGTVDDPYIISGWKIEVDDPSQQTIGVALLEDIHVVIRDNWLIQDRGGNLVVGGLAGSVLVENNRVEMHGTGKTISLSTPNQVVRHNEVIGGSIGMMLSFGGDATVEYNEFAGQTVGAIRFLGQDVDDDEGSPGNFIRVAHNNFMATSEWGVQVSHVFLIGASLADARDNYWGHPDGPRVRIHSACCLNPPDIMDPRDEGGAYASLGTIMLPFSSEPIPSAGVREK